MTTVTTASRQDTVLEAAAHLYVWALKDIPQGLRDALTAAPDRERSATRGFPDEAIEPMQRYFAIVVGAAAALETTQIEEIEEVAWEELMPECLWRFRVKDFVPLTVGIDAHGGSLYRDVQDRARTKLEELYARLQ